MTNIQYITPISKSKLTKFKKTLESDKIENLLERLEYFFKKEPEKTFGLLGCVEHLINYPIAVIYIPCEDQPSFAFSIGLYYFYELPEIILVSADLEMNDVKRIINQIAKQTLEYYEKHKKPAYSAGDTVNVKIDDHTYSVLLENIDPAFLKEYAYGYGELFYRNFMDISSFTKDYQHKILKATIR